MKEKLSYKEKLYIGMMVFGLFFGAGNLIFPIQMGQEAGRNVLLANNGFLLSAIGIPFLAIISFGATGTNKVFELASKVSSTFAYFFTIVLYLIIGPIFAMPRLATTSYEMSFAHFIPEDKSTLPLFVFSVVFFLFVLLFSFKPSKILDYIGKYLTPLFLILLSCLIIVSFVKPMGSIEDASVQASYQSTPFVEGFLGGYNTLDALAGLAFGAIIIESVKGFGIQKKSRIAVETMKSGVFGIVLMGVIYTLLSIMGAMSLGTLSLNKNGGVTLSQLADYYLGVPGNILLGLIVIVACLKTAIGLATSFGKAYSEMFSEKHYLSFVLGCLAVALMISNVGLNAIITASIPVLMFIYPLAMVLILLSLLSKWTDNIRNCYKIVIGFTVISSVLDAIRALPEWMQQNSLISSVLSFSEQSIPFFTSGLSWIIFAFVGLIISLLFNMAVH
ncbi:branched-chain amino acid transport system II carrier protein [Vagococcus bubulae]|uniref:Branched-chain amino acid transport system carrier protein n=1 Tax=Vagococcus bubulae TaxID=1977868 RepID=A0A429Z9Y6_9ENTE|nr:branched-chain amino acid transport system II carrier protein [Vagococcus bubulae]RST90486.1 branched-chain amino acid transport system II carrier protein [Vagococcus bubulae]